MADERARGYRITRPARDTVTIQGVEGDPYENTVNGIKLRRWFDAKVQLPLLAKVQAWMSDVGSKMAVEAGQNVTREAHEGAELDAAGKLEDVLKGSNGYHFEVRPIMKEAVRRVRRLVNYDSAPEEVHGFLAEFVDILGSARNLSARTKAELLQLQFEI